VYTKLRTQLQRTRDAFDKQRSDKAADVQLWELADRCQGTPASQYLRTKSHTRTRTIPQSHNRWQPRLQ